MVVLFGMMMEGLGMMDSLKTGTRERERERERERSYRDGISKLPTPNHSKSPLSQSQ